MDCQNLTAVVFNNILQDTYTKYHNQKVRLKDGRVGTVVGVDPRPKQRMNYANYLVIVLGQSTLADRIHATPEEVTLVA